MILGEKILKSEIEIKICFFQSLALARGDPKKSIHGPPARKVWGTLI